MTPFTWLCYGLATAVWVLGIGLAFLAVWLLWLLLLGGKDRPPL